MRLVGTRDTQIHTQTRAEQRGEKGGWLRSRKMFKLHSLNRALLLYEAAYYSHRETENNALQKHA